MDKIYMLRYFNDVEGANELEYFPHKTKDGAIKHLNDILEERIKFMEIDRNDDGFVFLKEDNVFYDGKKGDLFTIEINETILMD